MWNGLVGFVQRCHARMVTFEVKREEGQAMVEYGLILGLVSVVAVAALALIGTDVNKVFNEIVTELGKA